MRAAAERTQAHELTATEERHRADIAHLETEAAENRDAATREAQARAEAQAADRLTAELARVRAAAERTLAAELATAEERHGAEIARLETENRDTATREAPARAEAQADGTLAAAPERGRTGVERTLADELAAAQERHYADLARLEAASAGNRDAVTRDAQEAAEALADETLATERDQVSVGAVRTLAAQLAAAEERHRTDLARLEAEAAESRDAATRHAQVAAEALASERDRVRAEVERRLAAEITRLETEAAESRADIIRLETEAGEQSTALSPPSSLPPSVEPVHGDDVDASRVTDYYNLWRARVAAVGASPVKSGVARPPQVDPRRRRWALSVAATVLILLTNGLGNGSVPRSALAAVEAGGENDATAPTRPGDQKGARMAPTPGAVGRPDPWKPAAEDNPGTGRSGRAPFERLAMEAMCVLAVMLLLHVALFVGEGYVWHGLVATLGLTLLGFFVMRASGGG